MKLLFVVNDADFFVSHRLPIATAAIRQGNEVELATGPSSEQALEAVRHAGIVYRPIPFDGQSINLVKEIRAFLGLLRLFRKVRPDVVHLVTPKVVLYGGIAARVARVTSVVSALCGMGYICTSRGLKARLLRPLVLLGLRSALRHRNQRVIVQNHDDLNELASAGITRGGSLRLIPGSGVDLELFRQMPLPPGPLTVVLPARMLWDKGVGEFVEAARVLRRRNVECRMVLAGTASHANPATVPRETLEAWVREGVVEWLGHCDDMPTLLAASHVVCLPSYYREGVPKALLEAAACGRPVVTTDSIGCREAIEAEVTGILVPVRDATRLADALERIFKDAGLRQRMGEAGRMRAEQLFSVKKVVSRTLDIYRELVAGALVSRSTAHEDRHAYSGK